MLCFDNINIIDFAQVQGRKTTQISVLIEMIDASLTLKRAKESGVKYEIVKGLVALTFIDSLMKETHSYAIRMLKALGGAKVNIEMITSAQQYIVVVVKNKDLNSACQTIAEEFDLLE